MTADDWQARISGRTGEAPVPVFNRKLRGDRPFWVPRRYRSVVAVVMDGRPFRQRELADRTGYSLKGVNHALRALHKMAIGTLTTVRGCYGSSRFVFNRDCSAGNVSTDVAPVLLTVRPLARDRSLVETFGRLDAGLYPPGVQPEEPADVQRP